MITAYVLNAIIIFMPGPTGNVFTDRALPIKMSFETQEQCTATLRSRIAEHMQRTGMASVRREKTRGTLCQPMETEAAYTQADDLAYREQVIAEIRGEATSQDVLSEFSK